MKRKIFFSLALVVSLLVVSVFLEVFFMPPPKAQIREAVATMAYDDWSAIYYFGSEKEYKSPIDAAAAAKAKMGNRQAMLVCGNGQKMTSLDEILTNPELLKNFCMGSGHIDVADK